MLILGQTGATRLQAKGIIPGQQLQARAAPAIGAFAVIFSKENLVLGGSRIAAFFDLEQKSLVLVLSQSYRNKQLIFYDSLVISKNKTIAAFMRHLEKNILTTKGCIEPISL
jgi:hypothetical protein